MVTSGKNSTVVATLILSYQITATNFPTSFSAQNLPNGVSINESTGLISGYPEPMGVYNVTISATNSGGTGSAILIMNILTALLFRESFDYPEGTLDPNNGGYGFAAKWYVQTSPTLYYKINSTFPLISNSNVTTGNYSTGGGLYESLGRLISVANTSRNFKDTNNVDIGKDGTTLWFGALIRKSGNQPYYISFHPQTISWYDFGSTKISFGFFGATSTVGGVSYWGIRPSNLTTVMLSNKTIAINQTILLVVQFIFGYGLNNDSALLFINPDINQPAPTVPDARVDNYTIQFKSFYFYPGQDPGQGSLDEIRLGISFRAVTSYWYG